MSRQLSEESASETADDLSHRLAAYDEHLRRGDVASFSATTIAVALSDPETSSLVECLHLLERAWPRSSTHESVMTTNQIGRFQLERVLGVGGFGIVYKAFDPTLQRQVALKVPRLHSLASEDLLARFAREAQAAASLDHPNIVPIHETGQAGSCYYIAAAYCPGPNLAEWQKSQPVSVPQRLAAGLVAKLAAAVQYSHSRGILHRDLKPSNVLLVPHEGTPLERPHDDLPFVPRLTDFGLAKILQDNLDVSSANAETISMGTPAYMAPEQTGLRDLPVGPETDVYGLGVILYELLTGRPPFQGTNVVDLFDQIRNDEPVAPRRLRREINQDLETICLKCLDKNPTRRFRSAQALADELGRSLRGEPIVSRPVSVPGRLVRWCRRKPTAAALVAVSTTAAIAIVGLLAAHERSLAKINADLATAARQAKESANDAKKSQRVAEENERQVKDSLYVSDINRAAAAWKDHDTRVMTELLDRHVPRRGEIDRRGFEWWYLHRQANRSHRVLVDAGSAFYTLKMSSDQRLMAVAGRDATVGLFDPETGGLLQEIPTGQTEVNCVAFSPDGSELATSGDDGTIRFWNLATHGERLKIKSHSGKVFQLIFTPDGRQIISCGDDPIIRVFDVRSGEEQHQLHYHHREVQSLMLGTDGKTFGSTGTDSLWVRWDLNSWKAVRSYKHKDPLGPLVMRDDRDFVLVGSELGELLTINTSTNALISVAKHQDGLESIAVHPNGQLVAVGTSAGIIRWWNLGSMGELSESQFAPWQAHQGRVYAMEWSADGSRLISTGQDGRVISWNASLIQSENPKRIDVANNVSYCLIPKTDFLLHTEVPPASTGMTVLQWRTGTPQKRISEEGFSGVAASADGQFVAGLADRRELRLFGIRNSADGVPTVSPLARWMAPGELECVRFSPDSKSIAVSHWYRPSPEESTEHFVWLLGLPDFEQKERIPVSNAKAMAFLPNGKHLIMAAGDGLTLWSLTERRVIWNDPLTEWGYVTCSPDGSLLASAGVNRVVVIRNSIDGTIRFRMSGHRGRIRGITFSRDGRTLVTSDSEGTLKFWNVAIGQEMFEITHKASTADRLEFSEDGQSLFLLMWPLQKSPEREHDEILIFDATKNAL